jgi:signal transduction histidine kinase
VHQNNIFRATTFRLASLYVLLFAASVAVLGVITYSIIPAALEHRLDARIRAEMASLLAAFRSDGLAGVQALVNEREREHPTGLLHYAIISDRGERLAGKLSRVPIGVGWSDMQVSESDGDIDRVRVLTSRIGADGRAAVAADREEVDDVKAAILDGFVSAFGALVVLGITGGIALSLAFLKRVETIRRTAEAIIAGDLMRRVPVRGTGDDLDRLSQTLNRMLDRIAELMESLKQVSTDIAHDLKTPLTQLRQRLELAQGDVGSLRTDGSLAGAAVESIDGILATFDALLRIAQIEAHTRRSGFRELDLSDVFTTVVEAFAPSAEEAGKSVIGRIPSDIRFSGDRELLTQMLANLIENAIRHTPTGTKIEVTLRRERDQVVASVADNGPGVPQSERERIFRRLHRLVQSRSTPGSGPGLSLVRAVADLHFGTLEVLDAHPGLAIVMKFPIIHGIIPGTVGRNAADQSRMVESSS